VSPQEKTMQLFDGKPIDEILRLINLQNTLPAALVASDLYFGKMRPGDTGKIILPTTAMWNSQNYEGSANFQYQRIDLTKAFGGVRPVVKALGQLDVWSLLPAINKAVGINLTTNDVVNTSVSWLGGNEQLNIELKADQNSLGYTGSFVVRFTRLRPMLATAVTTTELPVLVHPQTPDATLKCIDLLSWGIDFSDYQAHFLTRYGYWVEWEYIQGMMAENGFPNYPGPLPGTTFDYLTKDVPEANQAFTNVVVQKAVSSATYHGTAYIHYNRA
jgi:hypothetical protein